MSETHVPAPLPPATPARRRGWLWAWALLLALLLMLAGLIGSGARTEAGARWLLQQVPGLSAEGIEGSLFGDRLTVRSLRWEGGPEQPSVQAGQVEVRGLAVRLWPHPGAWVGVSVNSLKAANVQWRSPRTPGPAAGPLTQLALPFALQVDTLDVARLQLDEQTPWLDLHGGIDLGADDGRQHRVAKFSLRNDRARVQIDGRIDAQAPMALAMTLRAEPLEGAAWQAQARADGPLAGFAARATLRGEGSGADVPSVDAQGRIEPFAAWPLASLQLSTRALDLATLSSQAPRTRIDAQADVQSAGVDRPARASVQLQNLAPGRWDAQRVPVRQLQVELGGTPNQLDRIEITRLDALMADERGAAGRVQGGGQWAGSRLQLNLKLTDVDASRLHGSAGAVRAGGPLRIEVDGLPLPTAAQTPATPSPAPNAPPRAASAASAPRAPAPTAGAASAAPITVHIDANLDGTLGGTTRQVHAEFALSASADTVTLKKLAARSGDAQLRATLKAERQRDGAGTRWQVASDGEVARLDPLLWWPGEPGTAWARGPHRLDGHWTFDLRVPAALADLMARDRNAAIAALRGQLQVELNNSQVAGTPLSGRASLRADERALGIEAALKAADSDVKLDGQWAADPAQDRFNVQANAPALARLQPLITLVGGALAAAWPQAGAAQAQVQWQGRWPALRAQGNLQTRGLRNAQLQLTELRVQGRFANDPNAPLELTLRGSGLQHGEQRVDAIDARVDGTLADHRFSANADSPLRPPAWSDALLGASDGGSHAVLEGRGHWRPANGGGGAWESDGTALHIGARRDAKLRWLDVPSLQGRLEFDARGALVRAQAQPGRAALPGGAGLRWSVAQWQAEGSRFELRSELEPLQLAPWLARLQPELGWAGDLTLGGRIDVRAAERFDADIVLARADGDLRIADEAGQAQPLGISEMQLAFSAHDGVWRFAQGAAGRQLGEMAGAQVVRTGAAARWPAADAPLQGVLQMRVANLQAWGVWVPPGWRLGGNLRVNAEVGGRFGGPELRGALEGRDLAVRNLVQGVSLTDGELAVSLDGTVARVQTFSFKGGDGRLQLTGDATLGDAPSVRLHLNTERFRVIGRLDRRIVTSGNADMTLTRESLKLDGRFTVDEGLFDFSRGNAPALDGDVTIARPASAPVGSAPSANTPAVPAAPASAATAAALPASAAAGSGLARDERNAFIPEPMRNAQVNLAIGLGDKLHVKGRGLDTSLRGDLRVSTPGGRLAVNGIVRTASGTYIAYAQRLVIDRGELAFTGAPDNPRLDVLALRPNLDVRVGVAVTGTISSPRVRLYSEPDMSDMDKLSWLMLGRASDGLGRNDTALLQRAALALLAGEDQAPTDQLLSQLGITDFSFRQTEGEVRETIVSLGRQLSQRWYVGYERSVNATTGTWQLVYRIAQRFTLRAQSGAENALDLIWAWRW